MFGLACLDSMGTDVARVATDGDRWAVCVVHPGRTLVPMGSPDLIARLGVPTRRWRMIIGDVAACLPLLVPDVLPDEALVHHQRFMLLVVCADHRQHLAVSLLGLCILGQFERAMADHNPCGAANPRFRLRIELDDALG